MTLINTSIHIFCECQVYLVANCMAKSSSAVLRFCCNSFKMLAASSSNFSPPIDSNIFSNCTLSCCTLFIKIHAYKCTKEKYFLWHKCLLNCIAVRAQSMNSTLPESWYLSWNIRNSIFIFLTGPML